LRLGIAYHHLGQNDAALQAFDTEERLGVVRGSAAALAELQRQRQLALDARQQAAGGAGPRMADVLRQSVAEARGLAQQRKLDEAMNALGRGLAVAPEDREAGELMATLRSQVLTRDRAKEAAAAAERDLQAARAHLEGGRPEQAASLLRQVLAAGPNAEASRLLASAQETIAAATAAGTRTARIAEALAAARRFAAGGKAPEALAQLELVLALDPQHAEASALRTRLAAAQGEAQQHARLDDQLALAQGHLAARRFEEALSAANLVLAVDHGQPQALDLVRRAYGEISRRLLSDPAAGNIPPAIRFADLRREEGGTLAERVREAQLRLNGIAIDRSPVTIAVRGPAGRSVPATTSSQQVGDYYVTEFQVQSPLPAGPTMFRVVATDRGGLSSTSEYAVIYQRPWFRWPPLQALALIVPGTGLAGLLLWRNRRRHRRLRRRFNPYIAGGPVFAEELFFGREALLQRILQTIHTNSLLLHGERRIGKTSILHQLRRRLERMEDREYQFYPVYVDLQGTPEEKFFATLADQIFETLAPVVGDAGRSPAVTRAGYSHHDLVRELHDLLRALQERSVKRIKLVLLIDEVDELNHYDPRVNQKLRSLFMKRFAESLVAVVAGVRIRKEWEKETSPWYNFFEEVEVDAIAAASARELVLRPIRGVFRVEAGVAERITAISAGRPYLIQRHCLALVNRLHDEGRRTLTLADVEALAARGRGGEG
ncbi:MAG TPA: ATP-binding protein, partial [Thermoanaerobaculia bacterium]|nr:ATP-binding protein [Thermoanaerobaculia bacterium]